MRIVIAGGSGLLGSALTKRLVAEGRSVTVLSRKGDGDARSNPRHVAWNADGTTGAWASEIDGADAVVNLAGAGIADKRWTPERKALLESSRVLSTKSLVAAVQAAKRRPDVFVQGSAMGYYGASLDATPLDESAPAGKDFLGHLASTWEATAAPVTSLGVRLALLRTGLVLSAQGGALPELARPFRFFAGGPMASGRQYMSWIHVDDWTRLVSWLISTPGVSGVFNGTAPHPVTNAEFAKALGRALHRPSLFRVPGFVLRIVVGEMADPMLILGQNVVPRRTQASGFKFGYGHLNAALGHVLEEAG